MGKLTKAEKQILENYGNNPNYRIETDSRNKIVAIQINNDKTLTNGKDSKKED